MPRIPEDWMPACPMERIICHWTVGRYRANDVDKAAYHILIEGDGNLVRGTYSIKANSSLRSGVGYAAHTKSCNTRSIGISCCSMFQSKESPFDGGPEPMKEEQWLVMAEVAAELCAAYGIPVTPATVLGHGEVQETLGKAQNGKWDPMVLPWDSDLPAAEVGELFRQKVRDFLDHEEEEEPVLMLRSVVIKGREFEDAFIENESVHVSAQPVIEAFGLQSQLIEGPDSVSIELTLEDRTVVVPVARLRGEIYADVREIAELLDLSIDWNARTKVVTLE